MLHNKSLAENILLTSSLHRKKNSLLIYSKTHFEVNLFFEKSGSVKLPTSVTYKRIMRTHWYDRFNPIGFIF